MDEEDEHARDVYDHLVNTAFAHGLTFASDLRKEMEMMEAALAVGEHQNLMELSSIRELIDRR